EMNDSLDRAIFKPIALGYETVVPGFMREGVNNFFENLADFDTGLNNILQGKPKEGFSDLGRVVVNSVFGIFGLWDVASPMGFDKHFEDFGQTLAVWGVADGPYFVIPFLGPSTVRDAPARAANVAWYYFYPALDSPATYWSFWTLDKVNTRVGLLKA